ncbi:MAG: hypothetical protein Q4C89_10330 [Deinococcus sp.]|nr:hypothetical protein [Deinococcus sp.]MDO4246409.1 hypothetical protein [Deinococcus sp.]
MQLDFIRLMRKAQALAQQQGDAPRRPYLLRVGLAPLTDEEARGLFRS